jgi:hypothetical protein
MEVSELKEVIERRFDALDKRLDRTAELVITHDHWLWFLRGSVVIIIGIISWLGVKIRF